MKHIALFFGLAFCIHGNTQTKLISYKSHSGSKTNFNKVISKNLFNIGESNFGMSPQRFVRNSQLDSVILISEKIAIMVTSESCHYEDYNGSDRSTANLWSAGKDTVFAHEVFSSGKSVTEIRKILEEEYFFSNPIESIVFVGFDGEYAKTEHPKTNPPRVKTEPQSWDNELEDEPTEPKRKSLFSIIVLSLISFLFKGSI